MNTEQQFLRDFGQAIRNRRAAVFIGAGVSRASGFPDWQELIAPLRIAAEIPDTVDDPTLAAEYAKQQLTESVVEEMLLERLMEIKPSTSNILSKLSQMDIAEIWTTNFDTLIEDFGEDMDVVASDIDYRSTNPIQKRRLTKLHGSLPDRNALPRTWRERPTFSRNDFEKFEREHPFKWAMLRAQFLTSSFLFLGFSFSDPNAESLLRIMRSLPSELRGIPHYAVMKRPSLSTELRAFSLFVADMQSAGVNVIEVNDYSDIPALLDSLVRYALPPNIFVSGSSPGDEAFESHCEALGKQLLRLQVLPTLISLDGPASRLVARAYIAELGPELYDPQKTRFFYRKSPSGEPSINVPRVGTAIFSEKELDAVRVEVFSMVRVAVMIGGSARSAEEISVARSLGVPVVPIAAAGGSAATTWAGGPESCGFPSEVAGPSWDALAAPSPETAAAAAIQLLTLVMPS